MSRRRARKPTNLLIADPEEPREASAWLRDAAAHRLAQAAPLTGPVTSGGVAVALYLTEAPAALGHPARARWEFTCDRCGHWCAVGELLVPVIYPIRSGRAQVVVMAGLCEQCGIAEKGTLYAYEHGIRRPTPIEGTTS